MMKKWFFTLCCMWLMWGIRLSAQEQPRPMVDTQLERNVSLMDIEGEKYRNVLVTLKAISPDEFLTANYRVKVMVTDAEGKKVYEETLKNVYLYLLPDDDISVGKAGFVKLFITKRDKNGRCVGIIREKNGVN